MAVAEKYFERLRTIDHLIRTKRTGTPERLAVRLGISERSLYDFLTLMKGLGAPIKYSKERESYFYEDSGGFIISFVRE